MNSLVRYQACNTDMQKQFHISNKFYFGVHEQLNDGKNDQKTTISLKKTALDTTKERQRNNIFLHVKDDLNDENY